MKKQYLDGVAFKWAAVLLMILNHLCIVLCDFGGAASYFFTDAHWYLTRIAFVFFAFFISEGMIHTHSRPLYLLRLGIFALFSEVPFDLCFHRVFWYSPSQNVFFTLLLGALAIALWDVAPKLLKLPAVLLCCLGAQLLATDYSFLGVITIFVFYVTKGSVGRRLAATAAAFAAATVLFYLEMFGGGLSAFTSPVFWRLVVLEWHGLPAFPLLLLYSGQPGKSPRGWLKYYFYLFYPVHLLLFYFIV